MSANMVAVLYLLSALLFIFALRGLSHPESSRLGNIFGIVGMVIAIITTLMFKSVLSYTEIGAAIIVGGAIGTFIALRIEMTALPQLVAAFHSLVGIAAVFVAAAAFYDPESFGIGNFGSIGTSSLVEMSIGTFIGAITFSGSILAFGKLQGTVSGKPIVFRFQHTINALILLFITVLIVIFVFNTIKLVILKLNLNITPITNKTFVLFFLILTLFFVFYFWNFNYHPIVNIILKTIIIAAIYLFVAVKLRISNEINQLLTKILKFQR